MKSTMPAAVVYPQALWDLKREVLIPITIDVQLHGLRVLDTLVWDAAQQQVCAGVFNVTVPSKADNDRTTHSSRSCRCCL